MGHLFQSYGASPAIWLLATQPKWTHSVLTPARQAGTRFTYPRGIEGWVDLGCVFADIVLAAGSDKTVHVFDINAARCVRVMTDVHTRAVHHIAQNHVSQLFAFILIYIVVINDCNFFTKKRFNVFLQRF